MAVINVKVKTNAAQDRIEGFMADGTLKIAVCAKPVKGQANRSVLRVLAGALELRPDQLALISGLSSTRKAIRLPMSQEEVFQRLNHSPDHSPGGKK